MEKPPTTKSINKILKLLPKVSQAAVSFQNPTNSYSPGSRDHHHHHHHRHNKHNSHLNKGFYGTIIPFIPNEKSKNYSGHESTQEPTSPKISCMGQIKHKHEMCKKKHSQKKALTKSFSYLNPRQRMISQPTSSPDSRKKKTPIGISKLFNSSRRKSDASANDSKPRLPDRAPSLSQMRRFASSRDTLADFDWLSTARIAVEEDCRDLYYCCSDDDDADEDVVIIPLSASITAIKPVRCGGDLEPKKEINLWKRRTMAQPKPLQLDMVRSSTRNKLIK